MTQEEMGKYLEKGKAAVSKYENGDAFPPLDALSKYQEIGGVTYNWIFTGNEESCVVAEDGPGYHGIKGIEFELAEEVLRQFPEPERFRVIGDLKEKLAEYLQGKEKDRE